MPGVPDPNVEVEVEVEVEVFGPPVRESSECQSKEEGEARRSMPAKNPQLRRVGYSRRDRRSMREVDNIGYAPANASAECTVA